MNKTLLIGVAALLVFGLIVSTGAVTAFGIKNEAAREALKAGNFEAWKQAMSEKFSEKISEKFSEERFNMLAEMQEARQTVEDALEAEDYEAWKAAIENLDIASLKNRRGLEKLTEKITEENFDKYVELHNTMKRAKELREELGIDNIGTAQISTTHIFKMDAKMKGFRKGFGRGFHRGMRAGCPMEQNPVE